MKTVGAFLGVVKSIVANSYRLFVRPKASGFRCFKVLKNLCR